MRGCVRPEKKKRQIALAQQAKIRSLSLFSFSLALALALLSLNVHLGMFAGAFPCVRFVGHSISGGERHGASSREAGVSEGNSTAKSSGVAHPPITGKLLRVVLLRPS